MESRIINYFKGRGAQFNPHSRFQKSQYVQEHVEGLDEEFLQRKKQKSFILILKRLSIK